MIVTTTPTVEGYPVTQYLRVVCGETIAGVNMFKDIAAGFRNVVGGRSESYEREPIQARGPARAGTAAAASPSPAAGNPGRTARPGPARTTSPKPSSRASH